MRGSHFTRRNPCTSSMASGTVIFTAFSIAPFSFLFPLLLLPSAHLPSLLLFLNIFLTTSYVGTPTYNRQSNEPPESTLPCVLDICDHPTRPVLHRFSTTRRRCGTTYFEIRDKTDLQLLCSVRCIQASVKGPTVHTRGCVEGAVINVVVSLDRSWADLMPKHEQHVQRPFTQDVAAAVGHSSRPRVSLSR